MPATLFVVSTPIGNLEDITLRAMRTLREVAVIAAEDTRRTGHLLQHFEIRTPMISLHDHNERERTPGLLARLQAGESIALVSDAGTPLLSDPGYHLVREAVRAGVPVQAVPGPSSLTAALAVSGLPVDRFTFVGFPPARKGQRGAFLARLAGQPGTLVLFEAPQRIRSTLEDVRAHLGERMVVLARELTKVHETVFRGWISELLAGNIEDRGEYVVLVSDQVHEPYEANAPISDNELRDQFGSMTKSGAYSPRDAVAALAEQHRVSKQRVYKATARNPD
jgi:16S rRNA (cytidine1402-2'-O)-methyltransferase